MNNGALKPSPKAEARNNGDALSCNRYLCVGAVSVYVLRRKHPGFFMAPQNCLLHLFTQLDFFVSPNFVSRLDM